VTILFSIFIALLAGGSVLFLLSGDRWSLVLAFALLGGTAKMVLLVSSGREALALGQADPLPQALILTAIVISMAVVAWLAVFFARSKDDQK
jgi:multisubunit Na+/H+ antiporter MnhC subunit